MGHTVNRFEQGTPAWRVFYPSLVLGWEALWPVLYRWGLTVPEVLDRRTTMQAVRALRGIDFGERLAAAKRKASLREITEAESAEEIAIGWMILATWAARYERARREGRGTEVQWTQAGQALEELQAVMAAHVPRLD